MGGREGGSGRKDNGGTRGADEVGEPNKEKLTSGKLYFAAHISKIRKMKKKVEKRDREDGGGGWGEGAFVSASRRSTMSGAVATGRRRKSIRAAVIKGSLFISAPTPNCPPALQTDSPAPPHPRHPLPSPAAAGEAGRRDTGAMKAQGRYNIIHLRPCCE